jgi:excisionase family DNA binding protein
MKTIQFIQITPEEQEDGIYRRLKSEFETLKQEFQPKQPPEFLTRNEVRDLLKVDLSTVHNWTKRGKLKAYGIGNRVYYRRDEIQAAIKPLKV